MIDPSRFDVCLVRLDPAQGHELRKPRPCGVVSPDEMNRHLKTVIIAPLTTVHRPWPTRISVRIGGKEGQAALDQLRTVDRTRLESRIGTLDAVEQENVLSVLQAMFAR